MCTKKSKKFKKKKKGTAEAMTKNKVFTVLYIRLMGEGESIARIFPSGWETKF